MKRLDRMVVAWLVVLALAAPAAAAAPASGWSGWSWPSVAERLAGWADGLWRVVAGSGTGGEEAGGDTGGGEVTILPADPDPQSTGTEPDTGGDAVPELDPDG